MGHEEAWHKKLEEIDREARIRGSGVIEISDRDKLPEFIVHACLSEGRDTVLVAACNTGRRILFRATRDLVMREEAQRRRHHPEDDRVLRSSDGPGCSRIWFDHGNGNLPTVARFFWGGYHYQWTEEMIEDEHASQFLGLAPLALILHDPYHMHPSFGRHALSLPAAYEGRTPITVVSGCVSECGPRRRYESE